MLLTGIVVGMFALLVVILLAVLVQQQAANQRAYDRIVADLNAKLAEAHMLVATERKRANDLELDRVHAEEERLAAKKLINDFELRFKMLRDTTESQFKVLSESVLAERSEKLKSEGGEAIAKILDPLKSEIEKFRKRVDEVNSEDATRAGKLDERIAKLVADTNSVSERANELARAIRGQAQVTGAWGEVQLRRVIELAGLVENVDYTYQETMSGEGEGRKNLRMDVCVKLPGERKIVIDSKTTMEAFVEYAAAGEGEREEPLKRIVESVKSHIREIAQANYAKNQKGAFKDTLMYIPFEEVYLIAMKAEISVGGERKLLRDYARENDVLIVNSVTLLPVLELVEQMWALDNADAKAHKITAAAEALIEKFLNFKDSFDGIGRNLGRLVDEYNKAAGQLGGGPGNIVKRLNDLKELGVKNADKAAASAQIEKQPANGNA